MHAIDKYLSDAIAFIQDENNKFIKNGTIPKAYKGYVASFGTIIKQSGLLPAVVLFSHNPDSGDASKTPVLKAIFSLLKAESGLDIDDQQKSLLDFALANKQSAQAAKARRETIHAAIALKLALRTFKIDK